MAFLLLLKNHMVSGSIPWRTRSSSVVSVSINNKEKTMKNEAIIHTEFLTAYGKYQVRQTVCELPVNLPEHTTNRNGKTLNCVRLQKWGFRPILQRVKVQRFLLFSVVGLKDKHGHVVAFHNAHILDRVQGKALWELYAA